MPLQGERITYRCDVVGGAFRRFAPVALQRLSAMRISLRDMLEERWKIWSSEKGFMVDA